MNTSIRDSVGDPKEGAANRDEDVRTVQGLLIVQIVKDHRSDRLLAVDGRIGSATLGAIDEFQRRHSLPRNGLLKRGDAVMRALGSFSGPRGMRASGNLVDWMENPNIENFSALPYNDQHRPIPNATIGFGHKLHSGAVTEADQERWGPDGISRVRAEGILRHDLSRAQDEINREVRVSLTQNQFDALVSLTFNIGCDAFRTSTLLRLLNHGDYLDAADQFLVWTRSGSTHPRGLRTRREEERSRFERR